VENLQKLNELTQEYSEEIEKASLNQVVGAQGIHLAMILDELRDQTALLSAILEKLKEHD